MIKYMKRNDIFGDFRRGLSNSEISRNRNVSRTTVVGLRKLYNVTLADTKHPEAMEELFRSKPRYKGREAVCNVLTDEVKQLIDKDLQDNAIKAATGLRKQMKKATYIHSDIVKQGYRVSYRSVARYIQLKKGQANASVYNCFIKQKYVPGERMEFDWGMVKIYIKGVLTTYNMAAVALCSNGRWGKLFTKQDKQAMMEAHVNCFAFWGHVPQVMVYDNMRVAVKSFTGGEKTPTTELSQLEAYYGFKHQFCNVRAGNEKGHVERAVEIIRGLAFSRRDHFDSLDEANEYLLSVCKEENNKIQDAIMEELEAMTASLSEMSCYEAVHREVDKLSTICLDSVRYSVPYQYINRKVWVKKYSDKIRIYDTDDYTKKEIAVHNRSHIADDWVLDLQHYLNVMIAKPASVRNSLALRQAPAGLQNIFDTYFVDSPKDFIEMLLWAKDENYTYQDIISATNVAKMKGVHIINFDAIKTVLKESKSMIDVIDMPWSKSIEDGAEQNLASLKIMFNQNRVS